MDKKIKKGDPIVIYDAYANKGTGNQARETIVASAGSKWIVPEVGQVKFNAETLYGEWGGCRLFLGNMKEFEEWNSKERLRKDMIREIEHRLDDVTYEQALAIMQIIK